MAETSSETVEPLRDVVRTLSSEAGQSETRAVQAAAAWMFLSYALTLPAVAAAAVAGLSALNKSTTLAAVLAGVASVLTGLSTTLNPAGKATSYVGASREYRSLRFRVEMYASLDLPRPGASTREIEVAKRHLRSFNESLDGIRRGSPYLSRWTWWVFARSSRQRAGHGSDSDVQERNPPGSASSTDNAASAGPPADIGLGGEGGGDVLHGGGAR